MPFLIRHANVDDAEVVHAIIQAAFAEYRDTVPVLPGALNDTLESARERIAEGRTLLVLHCQAEGDHSVAVGTANYDPRPDHLYVGRVAVHPEWRRRGVGKLLMQEVEQISPTLGLTRLRLGTRESMPSNLAFYAELGYQIIEKEPHSRGPDTIVWLEKELAASDAAPTQFPPWACPRCHTPLQSDGEALSCAADSIRYPYEGAIPRLLDPRRADELEPFITAYRQQRAEEGWATPQPDEYYLSLPYRDTTGRHQDLWRLRQRHMERLFSLLNPVLQRSGATILDVGAGNCWLSYRLWKRGARPIAIDINMDDADGLGVTEVYRRHNGAQIAAAQAELERLPLSGASCDAVVINGSLHYAANPPAALSEALRVLRPGGLLIVMDSPVYRSAGAGQLMREEFIQSYTRRTGKDPAPIPGKGYLTYGEMRQAFAALNVPESSIRLLHQHTGLRAIARRAKLALTRRRRELATHPMWILKRDNRLLTTDH